MVRIEEINCIKLMARAEVFARVRVYQSRSALQEVKFRSRLDFGRSECLKFVNKTPSFALSENLSW